MVCQIVTETVHALSFDALILLATRSPAGVVLAAGHLASLAWLTRRVKPYRKANRTPSR